MMRLSRSRRAFTLIELLVVISIIALLISILLPALTKAREAARSTACLSLCRQLSITANSYQIDSKGVFPYMPGAPRSINSAWETSVIAGTNEPTNWLLRLTRHMKGNNTPTGGFLCPTTKALRESEFTLGINNNSYFANGVLTDLGGLGFRKPSAIISFGDNQTTTPGCVIRPALTGAGSVNDRVAKETLPLWSGWMRFGDGTMISQNPHDGGRNHSYMDGHANYLSWQDNTSLKYGLLIDGQDKHEDFGATYSSPGRPGIVTYR